MYPLCVDICKPAGCLVVCYFEHLCDCLNNLISKVVVVATAAVVQIVRGFIADPSDT
jgi:hypothetical protein